MSLITKDYTFSAGAVIVAAEHNANFNTIYNDYNGSITNANISASAAIADTKLASITTAGKVNVSALTVASQATGDLIYASSASAWARLGVGTATQLLHGGTTPAYSALVTADLPSGTMLQWVNTQVVTSTTGSTTIPDDDTIPQITEGDQYMTLAITPTSATSTLIITTTINLAVSSGAVIAAALFQDATANALAAARLDNPTSNTLNCITFSHKMTSGTTSSTTFRVRAGGVSGTMTFNGLSGARKLGGVLASSITIYEIK